jgi:DNA modification methylase
MEKTNFIPSADCLEGLRELAPGSVQCCVTSPPYYQLRDYGVDGQLGREQSPPAYIARLLPVFNEVRRVLKDDSTLWLNLGDSYCSKAFSRDPQQPRRRRNARLPAYGPRPGTVFHHQKKGDRRHAMGRSICTQGAVMVDSQEIIWAKPNAMPESVSDRCTRSDEYIFMLTKSPTYYYNSDAIKTQTKACT